MHFAKFSRVFNKCSKSKCGSHVFFVLYIEVIGVSVYLLPSRKTYSTRKTRSSIERTIVSKN